MLSTTTTALSTSMPTASSRPIIDRMLSVTPAKYMKPSVITKQIGMASVTIRADGAGFGQFGQRAGHVVAEVLDDLDLQVGQVRLRADRVHFRKRIPRHLHQ